MTLDVQYESGKLIEIIKSIKALEKEPYINIIKREAGYKEHPKDELKEKAPIGEHAKLMIESVNDSKYYIHLHGKANFPDNEKLKGTFDLIYGKTYIRIDAVTNELEEKLAGFLKSSFVAPSLLDLLKPVKR